MNHKYAHILTPIKIGNVILKNHLMVSKSVSQELQGPEHFPSESTIAYLEQYARNGAALVSCPIGSWPDDRIDNSFVSQFEMEDRNGRIPTKTFSWTAVNEEEVKSFHDRQTLYHGRWCRF
jgi:2,4-dienoyl-CoA reductase-like NADH-dependent reductase (Old Yellow Enzyme family)